jgi:hypothetical protein
MEGVGGRNRYCGEHGSMYVETILSGVAVAFKKTLTDADIISRREQIAFARLWRYIEARALFLAPKGIDRIVVERTSIDLMAGKQKIIMKTSDSFIEDLYHPRTTFFSWFGAQHFVSVRSTQHSKFFCIFLFVCGRKRYVLVFLKDALSLERIILHS